MFFVNKLTTTVFLLSCAVSVLNAADGVSPKAYKLTEVLGLPITNSILTTWVISILLIGLIRLSVGKPKLIPSKAQAVVENLVDGLKDLLEPIVGKKAFPVTFPLLIGLFIFIVVHNWSGLFPGVGVLVTTKRRLIPGIETLERLVRLSNAGEKVPHAQSIEDKNTPNTHLPP